MIQIIQSLDLTKMWGKDADKPSVVDCWEGKLFNVSLNKGEMLAQKYSCDINTLAKLESLHGQNNIVIISKNTKGKENGEGGFYYNDVITEIYTLAQYAKKEQYVSKFAKQFVRKTQDETFKPPLLQNDTIAERG